MIPPLVNNNYLEQTTFCNPGLSLSCSITMADIISLGYQPGDIIYAKITSSNTKGDSELSDPSNSAITAMQVPQVAVTGLTQTSTSTYAQISWNAITNAADTGYSPITAYNIYTWDGTTWTNKIST